MDTLSAALDELIAKDADLARACALAGRPPSRERPPGFSTLIGIIINQQVSQQAGKAIRSRLEDGLGRISPKTILGATEEKLRACGLSRAKVGYARAMAAAVSSGTLDLDALAAMEDDDARARLVEIKGFGQWSADIYLMFALGRADIWPVGDLALAASAEALLGLGSRPKPGEMEKIGQTWRPWRSAAAVMLWHYYRYHRRLGNSR